MKNIIFTAILLFSISINAQVYQTFSMHFVKVEGDLKAFETVQSEYMQKVAQNAVNNGDIAFWALFLASVEASYITGQTLHINGGMLMV